MTTHIRSAHEWNQLVNMNDLDENSTVWIDLSENELDGDHIELHGSIPHIRELCMSNENVFVVFTSSFYVDQISSTGRLPDISKLTYGSVNISCEDVNRNSSLEIFNYNYLNNSQETHIDSLVIAGATLTCNGILRARTLVLRNCLLENDTIPEIDVEKLLILNDTVTSDIPYDMIIDEKVQTLSLTNIPTTLSFINLCGNMKFSDDTCLLIAHFKQTNHLEICIE